MKLRVRTLSNDEAEFEVSAGDSVLQLKEQIERKWESMPANRQKLVHAGQILVDNKTFENYPQIKDQDRLVVIVSKVSNAPTAQPPAAAPQPTPVTTTPAVTTANTPALDSTSNLLATGDELQESINNLVAMGFPLDRVQVAMTAAFNNPERAVEYLMNGIPDDVLLAFASDTAADQSEESTTAGENMSTEASGALEALRQHPNFEQMRQMVQTNPQVLPQILQMIGATNPQLLMLITQHQEEFLELLNGPPGGEGPNASHEGGGVIHLSETEMEALQRLEALGFTRQQAAEAYLACDRNEELAANYLFENLNDFGDDLGDAS